MNAPPDFPVAAARRRAVSAAPRALVSAEPLRAGENLPLAVGPALDGVDVVAWAEQNKPWLEDRLATHGAVLLRGFTIADAPAFERLIEATSDGGLLEYTYRSTPRSNVSERIYTSTEYPPNSSIPWHNENSYSRRWPMKLYFCARTVAERGGETPIVDSRRVYQRIPASIRDRFAERGVMYVRNYRAGLDLPWQKVFQTTDQAEVEAFCRRDGIECEWGDDGTLRTGQVCQAVARHPRTNEPVWFNQAHLFHVSALPMDIRDGLLGQFGESGLPRNAYYGDGMPIEAGVLDEIRQIYQEEQVVFGWEQDDVLAIDNMLVAHGRRPYEGDRLVFVGMAEGIEEGSCPR
jgi:alpha-ketoglutarate-dependent taurine dioxygenase